MKKPYFKNKWKEYSAISPDKFEPMPFDLFMDWRADNWELKRPYSVVIRATYHDNMKIKEYSNKMPHAAERRFKELMTKDNVSITVCNSETVAHINPKQFINDGF